MGGAIDRMKGKRERKIYILTLNITPRGCEKDPREMGNPAQMEDAKI